MGVLARTPAQYRHRGYRTASHAMTARYAAQLLALTAGWAAAANPPAPRVIGLLLPPEEPHQQSLREGAELGVAHAALETGVPARLAVRGRVGQWGADAMEAAALVSDDGAIGLIAPPDGAATHLVLQVAGRTATPVATLCGDASVTGAGVPWMVRITPRTDQEAEALLQHAIAAGNHTPLRWMVVTPEDRAGRECRHDMESAAKRLGLGPPIILQTTSPITNTNSILQAVQTHRPDLILLWLAPEPAGTLAHALRQNEYHGLLAGPGSIDCPAFTTAAHNAAANVLVATPTLDPDTQTLHAHFTAAYTTRFGRSPDPTAAFAYDAARTLLLAAHHAHPSPPHNAFPQPGPFPGATGTLQFDRTGNRTLPPLSIHPIAQHP